MRQFLVEVFAPRSRADKLAADSERVHAAAKRVGRSHGGLVYVRAIYVPEDETCFYVFEASSAQVVAQVSASAGLKDARIVETFDGTPLPEEPTKGAAR